MKEKTTIVAIVGFVGFFVLLTLLIIKIVNASDFGVAVGSWAGAIASAIGWFAGDSKKKSNDV